MKNLIANKKFKLLILALSLVLMLSLNLGGNRAFTIEELDKGPNYFLSYLYAFSLIPALIFYIRLFSDKKTLPYAIAIVLLVAFSSEFDGGNSVVNYLALPLIIFYISAPILMVAFFIARKKRDPNPPVDIEY
jgi:hypothetical protein